MVRQCVEGGLSQQRAPKHLRIGVRQAKQLVRSLRADGNTGLISLQRGRPCRIEEPSGIPIPTFAAEELAERHWIVVSAETVNRLQMGLDL